MNFSHVRHYLNDLQERLPFIRSLAPDSDHYKLWLGDLIEFVNVAYGARSEEMTRLRSFLVAHARPPADASSEERARLYQERLDGIAALLEEYTRSYRDPRIFLDGR